MEPCVSLDEASRDSVDVSDEADSGILGLEQRIEYHVEEAMEAQIAGSTARNRGSVPRINTKRYPGNLFEFMDDQPCPEGGITEADLWSNLPQDKEDAKYSTYFRMTRGAFDDLVERLRRVGPNGASDTAFIGREDGTRACVPGQRSYTFKRILALTLYFLARSATSVELASEFDTSPCTAWKLVGEGITALVRVLLHGVGGNTPIVRFPQTDEEKLAVIGGFEEFMVDASQKHLGGVFLQTYMRHQERSTMEFIGHLPWCIGAIDGTHIGQRKLDATRCPVGRDLYWGWKSKVSQLLVWIVDARGRALYITAGHPGSCSDAGVWGRDKLNKLCEDGLLSTPVKQLVIDAGGANPSMIISPYLVGDGAFRPKAYMMKCYPDSNTRKKAVFNQAVCDVRKVVEQAIGRLKMCWQFCHRNLFHGDVEFVKRCIEACVALHNHRMDYLIMSSSSSGLPF